MGFTFLATHLQGEASPIMGVSLLLNEEMLMLQDTCDSSCSTIRGNYSMDLTGRLSYDVRNNSKQAFITAHTHVFLFCNTNACDQTKAGREARLVQFMYL